MMSQSEEIHKKKIYLEWVAHDLITSNISAKSDTIKKEEKFARNCGNVQTNGFSMYL